MKDLANEIEKYKDEINDENFVNFCELLHTVGLEEAINNSSLKEKTNNIIRQIVWNCVNCKDIEFLKNYSREKPFAIAELLKKVIQTSSNRVMVITTNYDRFAEYATDHIGATAITGFEGSLIRKMEFPSNKVKQDRIRARERQVAIWKVHGSLDWFSDGKENLSFPLSVSVPNDYIPLIIPPGKDKYQNTYQEPYRSVITQADEAFESAKAYICVGYGFNDEHIQPKLITGLEAGKFIVVLARTISDSCKKLVMQPNNKYLLLEYATETTTKVYGNGWEETFSGSFWSLDEFMKVW